ncbi:hypothetical protein BRO54_3605 [Geobacillus proteiniphilus]|uniref:Uncharacterized protein n=2 Tax=Geobacillus TaxID=129337 RepID=A0A1Q5SKK5_9BACL|nr:hypothetical protein BRO54_3605 [Geobacillus proteiniphilus]
MLSAAVDPTPPPNGFPLYPQGPQTKPSDRHLLLPPSEG